MSNLKPNATQKANKNFVGARIPQDLYNHYEAHLEETGQKPTQLITAALSAYLNFPLSKSQDSITVDNERFHSLEDRVIALELALKEMQFQSISPAASIDPHHKPTVNEQKEQADVISGNIEIDNSNDRHPYSIIIQKDGSSTNDNDNTVEQDLNTSNSHNQLSILGESNPNIVTSPRRRLKTNEIPNLPGLEGLDPQKVKMKLRNTKNKEIKTTKIGEYTIEFAGQESGAKGSILWDVTKTVNT